MTWVANKSEDWVKKFPAPEGSVCISITEPGRAEEKPKLHGFHDTLRLEFNDIDPWRTYSKNDKRKAYFSLAQAYAVADFAIKHRGRPIIVHCAAGISRSGGIAEAILSAFPEYKDHGDERCSNPYVRVTALMALFNRLGVSTERSKELLYIPRC